MATANPLPSAGGGPARPVASPAPPAQAEPARPARGKPSPGKAEPGRPEPGNSEPSLIAAPPGTGAGETHLRAPVTRLPVVLEVMIPVRAFRVRHLLALAPGHLIETRWSSGEDLPLASGPVRLAWTEFEVVATQLAARITRLA